MQPAAPPGGRRNGRDVLPGAVTEPELPLCHKLPAGDGIRAEAMTPDGRPVEDFAFVAGRRAVHVLNAPSPAATACLAIDEEVAKSLASVVP
jgi:L-2-hydroxyglutarate oxidase